MNLQIIQHTKTPSESVQRLEEILGIKATKVLHYGEAVDKITQYEYFKTNAIPHPEWSINHEDAQKWLDDGFSVVCREKIKSCTGDGVFMVHPGGELVEAKVYCKYQKKKREFRVNLFQHKVVNIREKKRKAGSTGCTNVWNNSNGYFTTHVQQSIQDEDILRKLAEQASMVSNSDFIGVDVLWNKFYNRYMVLEVNSGPSIEGSSVKEYADAIQQWMTQE